MNLSADDPLADLLSSDNSFENEVLAIPKKMKAYAKATSRMEDLFGIREEGEETVNKSGSRAHSSTPLITKQRPTQSLDDVPHEDDDLGFDPKKPKGAGKANILDDLFETAKVKRPASVVTEEKRQPISRQSTDTATDNSQFLHTQTRPATSSAGRRSSAIINNADALSIFSGQYNRREANTTASVMSSPKLKKRSTTADWLGLGGDNTSSAREEENMAPTVNASKIADVAAVETDLDDNGIGFEESKQAHETDATAENIMLLNTMNMESQHVYKTLRQQESQLNLASSMKQQERALLEMRQKQEVFLKKQETQFSTMMQKQMQRQVQMEEQIRLQQQRINAHMQLMMMQPAATAMMMPEAGDGVYERDESTLKQHNISEPHAAALDLVHMEADIKRLELEKLRLEELVENIKTNYEKEVEIIENSYKKQLSVLEAHHSSIESRLKLELEELTETCAKKLNALESEKEKLKTEYENKIAELKESHETELHKMRESHEIDLDMLKKEYRRMLETIREAKMLEFAAVQENGSYMQALTAASANLTNISGGLQGLQENMENKIETMLSEKEQRLELRERRVEDAEKRLMHTQESAEEEKERLMNLVATLELQLSNSSKETAEENWILRQKMAALEADKKAFEREKEFIREQLERDEKRIADQKETELAEKEKMMLQLQEERRRLFVERKKIETERKLHSFSDKEKENLEVEAALKVAQDASRQADAERERYHKMLRQLEQQKRKLIDKENVVDAKEDELEQEIKSFRLAERQTRETQTRTAAAEKTLQKKLQLLQQRAKELAEKEEELSRERMLMARERLSMQNLRQQLKDRKCVLCSLGEQRQDIEHMLTQQSHSAPEKLSNSRAVAPYPNHLPLGVIIGQPDIVERMLDESIAASYHKMTTKFPYGNFHVDSLRLFDGDSNVLQTDEEDITKRVNDFLNKNMPPNLK